MKKWIAGFLVLVVLLTASIYIFIPSLIRIGSSTSIEGPSKALVRQEYEEADWSKWWPGNYSLVPGNAGVGSTYSDAGVKYTVSDRKFNSLDIRIEAGNSKAVGSSMNFIITNMSLAQVVWTAVIPATNNPFKRLSNWLRARDIKKAMDRVLALLHDSRKSDVKIYGLKIDRVHLKDTLLISSFFMSTQYPGMDRVYQLLREIREYGQRFGVKELGKPMLNISFRAGTDTLLVRVAIPVDRRVPSSGNIGYKLMPPNVQMLSASITGGVHAAEMGMQTVDHYATDHNYTPPAIPFFILETDRQMEKDSNRWVTRIFYPIM